MLSMLCSMWDDFSNWVTNTWSDATFIIVVVIFGVLGQMTLVSFLKGSFDKGKRPKWLTLILSIILLVLMGVLIYARYGTHV